jgi:hypothetical protein
MLIVNALIMIVLEKKLTTLNKTINKKFPTTKIFIIIIKCKLYMPF